MFLFLSHLSFLTPPTLSSGPPFFVFRMVTLKIVSLNVKGLNVPEKRRMLLHDLKHMHADVTFIEETYFRDASSLSLRTDFILRPTTQITMLLNLRESQ